MKKTTLKDIAQITGYSPIAVSKALRNHRDIAKETREFIQKTAAELGYVKNASAANLRSGSTQILALIISDITNPLFGLLSRHVERFAKENGYTVMVMNTDEIPEKELDAARTALAANVDGVLLVPCQKDTASIQLLEDHHVPYVLMGRRFSDRNAPCVVCDDYSGGYQAVTYLLEKGYRRILMLNADPCNYSSIERYRGYLQAHKDKNLDPDPRLCVYCGSMTGKSEDTLASCSALSYDSIFAFNDILAFQAIAFLTKNGIRVPQDISVVGNDDISASISYLYPLTSVTAPLEKLAALSVDKLLAIINGATPEPVTVLDVHLHIRSDTDNVPPSQII